MNNLQALTISIVLLMMGSPSWGQNWPEFRGPSGDGHAERASFPTEFGESKNVRWKTPIHGKAWSSPVIWGNKVWLTTATEDGKRLSVLRVGLESGTVEKDILLYENEDPDFCHPMNSYASPTPVVEDGKLYVHFGKYGTACLDADSGETIWSRRDLDCDHFRGPASSPILFEDLLIVAFDGFDQQYVVALNKSTGETVWKRDRDIEYGTDNGDFKKAYGTAVVIEVNGKPLLVYPSAIATIAYNPRTGEPVWTVYHGGMNVSSRPILSPGGLVLITNGMGQMVAVDPSGEGNVTETHVRWKRSAGVAKKSSLILVDDLFYMASDKGVLSCVDPETGETVWQERMKPEFAASPIYAGDKLYFCSRKGDVFVINPGRKFDLVAKLKLGDGFMASPAVAGDKLVLRSLTHLYCVAEN